MEILLKDGVRYLPYGYKKEEDFERIVFKHYRYLFGENTILFPKHIIRSQSGIGTIPDAFVLSLNKKKWYIIEVELSKHPVYQHIVPQVTKFYNAIKNSSSQKVIIKTFYSIVNNDPLKKAHFQVNGITEIYKFISETIETKPDIVIIIDKKVDELDEVCAVLPFNSKIIVFRTFSRENSEGLCDPIYLFNSAVEEKMENSQTQLSKKVRKVNIRDLINAGLINIGDKIYRYYKGKRYEAEILENGRIKLEDGTIVRSLSKAAVHISGKSENGWFVWKYKDKKGKDWLMNELRKKLQKV